MVTPRSCFTRFRSAKSAHCAAVHPRHMRVQQHCGAPAWPQACSASGPFLAVSSAKLFVSSALRTKSRIRRELLVLEHALT